MRYMQLAPLFLFALPHYRITALPHYITCITVALQHYGDSLLNTRIYRCNFSRSV